MINICVAYGGGGHEEQMKRLLQLINKKCTSELTVSVLTDSQREPNFCKAVKYKYVFREVRDKDSMLKTLLFLLPTLFSQVLVCLIVFFRCKPKMFITTGPGVGILPAMIFKLLKVKVVSFESWSRFEEPSITARILYKFSDLFFVQNKNMKKSFPDALYRGRL